MAPATRTNKPMEDFGLSSAPGAEASPQAGTYVPNPPPAAAPMLTLQQVELVELQTRVAQAEADRAEAEARLRLAQGPGAPALPPTDAAGPLGEQFPLLVRNITRELADVSVEDVDDIRTEKFEPWNLIRLHPVRGQRPSDNEGTSSVEISSGQFTIKKRNHLPPEYTNDPLVFVHSFLNFIYIYYRLFGSEHPDVVIAQVRFLSFITSKGQSV
ncbi:hypothetical protein E4U59_005872 [Claviceps monticola]|nr:hypothetical protein E4U59_005872 [Claviceps monticola]